MASNSCSSSKLYLAKLSPSRTGERCVSTKSPMLIRPLITSPARASSSSPSAQKVCEISKLLAFQIWIGTKKATGKYNKHFLKLNRRLHTCSIHWTCPIFLYYFFCRFTPVFANSYVLWWILFVYLLNETIYSTRILLHYMLLQPILSCLQRETVENGVNIWTSKKNRKIK